MKRTVVISGAGSGIGAATARLFFQDSSRLVLVDSSESALEQISDELGASEDTIQNIVGDVAEEDTCRRAVEAATSRFGSVDVLVNNAGIIRRTSTENTTLQEWNLVIATNLTAAFLMIRHVLPAMKTAGHGAIVNVASRAGKRPHPNAAPSYGASKAGLIYLTRHVALEFASHGITVNAVCPGPVDTDMFRKIDPARRQRIIDEIPLGRAALPNEVADLIVYLADPRSRYITGETVNINGGSLMD